MTVLPQSVEAEQSVLGAVLMNSDAISELELLPESFYRRDHQAIYNAMLALADARQTIDVLTVAEQLERASVLNDVGGMGYLAELAKNTPSAMNANAYARIVSDRYHRRVAIHAANQIIRDAQNLDISIADLSESMSQSAERVSGDMGEGPMSIRDVFAQTCDVIADLHARGDELPGISCGYLALDNYLGGFRRGQLITIAGRPSMGKSTLAVNMAEHVASEGKTALVFSLEMSRVELGMKIISSLSRIDHDRISNPSKLTESDFQRMVAKTGQYQSKRLFIDEESALHINQIRARARKVQAQHGLDLIVVDYLQLMAQGNEDTEDQRLNAITRGFKAMAKALNVPILLLSQLNRSVETRPNKQPILSDLRGSGGVEQDSDIVMMVYREDYYNKDSDNKGTCDILIRKARGAKTGDVRLVFNGAVSRFDNYDSSFDQAGGYQ